MLVNQNKLFSYVKSLIYLKKSNNGWYRSTNPFDIRSIALNDKTLGINFDFDKVHCFRTDYKASIMEFLIRYTGKSYRVLKEEIENQKGLQYESSIDNFNAFKTYGEMQLPEFFHLLNEPSVFQKRAINYLKYRKFDIDKLIELGVGYCINGDYIGRIIFPFVNNNKLVYFVARDFLGRDPKYLNPPATSNFSSKGDIFYNEDALILYDEVYLVEGVTDAITVGKQAIASLGWSLSKIQLAKLMMSHVDIINIIPDKGFYKQALNTALEIRNKKIKIANLDFLDGEFKDINDLGSIGSLKFVNFDVKLFK